VTIQGAILIGYIIFKVSHSFTPTFCLRVPVPAIILSLYRNSIKMYYIIECFYDLVKCPPRVCITVYLHVCVTSFSTLTTMPKKISSPTAEYQWLTSRGWWWSLGATWFLDYTTQIW